MSARTCQPYRVRPTTCLVHTSLKAHKYAHVPLARSKYVMSLTHTRLAWVGRGWSSSKCGTHRWPWVESGVRGVNAWGCKARRWWRRSPVRKA